MNAVVPFAFNTRKVAPLRSAPSSTSTFASKPKRLNRWGRSRSGTSSSEESISDEPLQFSWLQCGLSAFAYVWLLSNFLRTGLAVSNFDGYVALRPDVYINMGPYAYGVNTFSRQSADLSNVTSVSDNELWTYKYDTTSIAMRAFAEFLNVSAFPKPVLYKGTSHPEDLLSASAGFQMLDSLVDAVRDASSAHAKTKTSKLAPQDSKSYQNRPQTLLLRVSYEFFDRVHHYLFPQVFNLPVWRTCQALHYSSALLRSAATRSLNGNLTDICSMAYGGKRPYFCDEQWTHFSRSCPRTKAKCLAVRRVSLHTMQRLSKLVALNPNATVDMTIVESARDIEVNRGGLVFLGKRGFDIVTIFRVRSCTTEGENYFTSLLDDYRYEGESFTTDALGWYPIVIALRCAAQGYYWIRVFTLYAGCYFAVSARTKTSLPPVTFLRRTQMTLAMFFKIPSQVIIYGSAFPLRCYLLAHIVDSTIVYELLAQKFDTINGLFHLNFWNLVTISSVQMRNVWVLAGVAHVVARIATQRGWSPLQGVWGMPQFSIAVISSLTIISQFRYKVLRKAPVRSIQLLETVSRLHPTLESQLELYGGGGKATLAGIFMDVKAVGCSVMALFVLAGISKLVLKCICPEWHIRFVFWRSYSYTPLSAGTLWSTFSLAVSWNDDFFQFTRVENAATRRSSPSPLSFTKTHPFTSHQMSSQFLSAPVEMQSLDDRPKIAEAVMYLMNVTMLSDPIVFLNWRWNSSTTFVRYYRSSGTKRVYLVPVSFMLHHAELCWDDFTREDTISVAELSWSEIITCG